MKERWKPVVGYEGLYEVSDAGRVRSLARASTKGRVLRPNINRRNGYAYVTLSKHNVQQQKRIHRLVTTAFIGPSELQVNHVNGDKADNRLNNLEYCTQSENMLHAYRTGLEVPSTRKCICLDDGNIYHSLTDCAKAYGGTRANQITRVCTGKRKHFRKKKFMYLEEWEAMNG